MDETVFGQLMITRHPDGSFTAEWSGGRYLKISQELMHQADEAMFQRDGDRVTICQFTLRIIGRDEQGDYITERIDVSAERVEGE